MNNIQGDQDGADPYEANGNALLHCQTQDGITMVAKSVTALAKAVNDLRHDSQKLDRRILQMEKHTVHSTLRSYNGSQRLGRKKVADFLHAYNTIMSIIKALKAMPGLEETISSPENTNITDMDDGQIVEGGEGVMAERTNICGTTKLLRSIAIALSDIDVVSQTSQDDLSTADTSVLSNSRPTDYVQMKIENSASRQSHSPMQQSRSTLDLKQEVLQTCKFFEEQVQTQKAVEIELRNEIEQLISQKKKNDRRITYLVAIFVIAMCALSGDFSCDGNSFVQVWIKNSIADGHAMASPEPKSKLMVDPDLRDLSLNIGNNKDTQLLMKKMVDNNSDTKLFPEEVMDPTIDPRNHTKVINGTTSTYNIDKKTKSNTKEVTIDQSTMDPKNNDEISNDTTAAIYGIDNEIKSDEGVHSTTEIIVIRNELFSNTCVIYDDEVVNDNQGDPTYMEDNFHGSSIIENKMILEATKTEEDVVNDNQTEPKTFNMDEDVNKSPAEENKITLETAKVEVSQPLHGHSEVDTNDLNVSSYSSRSSDGISRLSTTDTTAEKPLDAPPMGEIKQTPETKLSKSAHDTPVINANDLKDTKSSNVNTKMSQRQGRSWVEILLCEEFEDMMNCTDKRSKLEGFGKNAYTTKSSSPQNGPFTSLVTPKDNTNPTITITQIDLKTLQRRIMKRQIFTAIGVAIIMALPQIAPHIFTFKLRSVLSIRFWRSLMEFLTVAMQ